MIKLKRSIMFLLKRKNGKNKTVNEFYITATSRCIAISCAAIGKYLRAPGDDLARSKLQNAPNL